jgi:hypothetical protein
MSALKRALLGAPRNIADPDTYHKIALIALLAWVGLGADGLSSSSYGPDEAFRELLKHGNFSYMAVGLALVMALFRTKQSTDVDDVSILKG